MAQGSQTKEHEDFDLVNLEATGKPPGHGFLYNVGENDQLSLSQGRRQKFSNT